MRKALSLILTILLLATLVACGNGGTTSSSGGDLPIPTDYEKPYTEDAADFFRPKSSSYDAQAEARRQEIINTADSELKPADGANTYYISFKGDDANDGLSKTTPWKTAKNLNKGALAESGSVILFERGGVYRSVSLRLNPGVSVGAYGEGPKPQLLGGDKDFADEALWKDEGGNIWSADVSETVALCPDTTLSPKDVGNIIFDHGKKLSGEYKQHTKNRLDSDYDFFYSKSDERVYLYLSTGNPASVHESIEMSPNHEAIIMRTDNHTVENLCIRYCTSGVGSAGADNLTVRNCEIGYIGGGMLSNGRAGNGITFFNTSANCVAQNNWIYQCYDAGYSHQSTQGAQTNITVTGNLIEYCLYNMELWTPADKADQPMKDCLIENNIMRFAGFGFGTINRMGSSSTWASHITFNSNKSVCDNVVIKNNVFDTSYRHLTYIYYPNTPSQPCNVTLTDNIWIQQPYTRERDANVDPMGTTAVVGPLGAANNILGCNTQAEMEQNVKKLDANPKSIALEGK